MARAKPLVVTLSAREVVAFREPFRAWGEVFHDAGVALDAIGELAGSREPVVLRAEAEGGSRAERASVEGDWLCEPDGSPPRRLPSPTWGYSRESREWSSGRSWLDAWERCDDARWLLHAAASAGVDRRLVVLAACDCARTALRHAPEGDRRPLAAIEAAEAWATRPGTGEAAVAEAALEADAAAYGALDDNATYAAYAAHYAARSVDLPAHAAYAANSAHWADGGRGSSLREMSVAVRRRIPAAEALRAALLRGVAAGSLW